MLQEDEAQPVLEALQRLAQTSHPVPFERLLEALELPEFELRRRLTALFQDGQVRMPTAFACDWVGLPERDGD